MSPGRDDRDRVRFPFGESDQGRTSDEREIGNDPTQLAGQALPASRRRPPVGWSEVGAVEKARAPRPRLALDSELAFLPLDSMEELPAFPSKRFGGFDSDLDGVVGDASAEFPRFESEEGAPIPNVWDESGEGRVLPGRWNESDEGFIYSGEGMMDSGVEPVFDTGFGPVETIPDTGFGKVGQGFAASQSFDEEIFDSLDGDGFRGGDSFEDAETIDDEDDEGDDDSFDPEDYDDYDQSAEGVFSPEDSFERPAAPPRSLSLIDSMAGEFEDSQEGTFSLQDSVEQVGVFSLEESVERGGLEPLSREGRMQPHAFDESQDDFDSGLGESEELSDSNWESAVGWGGYSSASYRNPLAKKPSEAGEETVTGYDEKSAEQTAIPAGGAGPRPGPPPAAAPPGRAPGRPAAPTGERPAYAMGGGAPGAPPGPPPGPPPAGRAPGRPAAPTGERPAYAMGGGAPGAPPGPPPGPPPAGRAPGRPAAPTGERPAYAMGGGAPGAPPGPPPGPPPAGRAPGRPAAPTGERPAYAMGGGAPGAPPGPPPGPPPAGRAPRRPAAPTGERPAYPGGAPARRAPPGPPPGPAPPGPPPAGGFGIEDTAPPAYGVEDTTAPGYGIEATAAPGYTHDPGAPPAFGIEDTAPPAYGRPLPQRGAPPGPPPPPAPTGRPPGPPAAPTGEVPVYPGGRPAAPLQPPRRPSAREQFAQRQEARTQPAMYASEIPLDRTVEVDPDELSGSRRAPRRPSGRSQLDESQETPIVIGGGGAGSASFPGPSAAENIARPADRAPGFGPSAAENIARPADRAPGFGPSAAENIARPADRAPGFGPSAAENIARPADRAPDFGTEEELLDLPPEAILESARYPRAAPNPLKDKDSDSWQLEGVPSESRWEAFHSEDMIDPHGGPVLHAPASEEWERMRAQPQSQSDIRGPTIGLDDSSMPFPEGSSPLAAMGASQGIFSEDDGFTSESQPHFPSSNLAKAPTTWEQLDESFEGEFPSAESWEGLALPEEEPQTVAERMSSLWQGDSLWGLLTLGAMALGPLLIWAGWQYYSLPTGERPIHALHGALNASRPIGLWAGIFGSVLFLLNLTYVARRRFGMFRKLISMRLWLNLHMLFGVLGGSLILVHSGLLAGNLIARISSAAILVAILSGLFGRYVLSHIPRQQEGDAAGRAELAALLGQLRADLRRQLAPYPRLRQAALEALASVEKEEPQTGFFSVLVSLLAGDFRYRMREKRLATKFRKLLDMEVSVDPEVEDALEETLELLFLHGRLHRRLSQFEGVQDLMDSWRGLHMILALIMVATMFLHVAIAISYAPLKFF